MYQRFVGSLTQEDISKYDESESEVTGKIACFRKGFILDMDKCTKFFEVRATLICSLVRIRDLIGCLRNAPRRTKFRPCQEVSISAQPQPLSFGKLVCRLRRYVRMINGAKIRCLTWPLAAVYTPYAHWWRQALHLYVLLCRATKACTATMHTILLNDIDLQNCTLLTLPQHI